MENFAPRAALELSARRRLADYVFDHGYASVVTSTGLNEQIIGRAILGQEIVLQQRAKLWALLDKR